MGVALIGVSSLHRYAHFNNKWACQKKKRACLIYTNTPTFDMASSGNGGGGEVQRGRTGSIGPVLTFQDSAISVIGGSFRVAESERSPSGYTVYKLLFKVGKYGVVT